MARPVVALDPSNFKNINRVKHIPGLRPLILSCVGGQEECEVEVSGLPDSMRMEASRHSRLLAEWTARLVFGATGRKFDSYKDGPVTVYFAVR